MQLGSSKKACARRPHRGSALCERVHAALPDNRRRGYELRATRVARWGRTAPDAFLSIFSVSSRCWSQHLQTLSHHLSSSRLACARVQSACARQCRGGSRGRCENPAAAR